MILQNVEQYAAVEAAQPDTWDEGIFRVIMEDDTAYEITPDSKAERFSNPVGPYSHSIGEGERRRS